MAHNVYLEHLESYRSPELDSLAARLLEAAGCRPAKNQRVLVKPNLVACANAGLSCTHPLVVRAVCRYLTGHGARVTVGDSPAFGPAKAVAKACGLDQVLAGLPVRILTLGAPRRLPLRLGGSIGVCAHALDADYIVNLPRFKAHSQMLLTLAVKNFFGCVCGFRKAFAHQTLGDKANRFESMIVDVFQAMPPSVSLVDGVVAMHVSGPVRGEAFGLGLLGASESPVALDAALHAVLGLPAGATALGREAAARGLEQHVAYPWKKPQDFAANGFQLPQTLDSVRFTPRRLLAGRVRSLLERLGQMLGRA